MFGFGRRDLKHVYREKIAYLKELAAVSLLLVLIMGALGFLAERSGEPTFVAGRRPAAEATSADWTDAPSLTTLSEISEDVQAPPVTAAPVSNEPARDESEFDGIDPLATPEVFDRFDRPDMMAELGAIIAHLPSEWSLPTQRSETPVPRVHVVVDKAAHTLTLFRGDEVIRQYGVAVGKNPGDKLRAGDNRTPEGAFPVQQIHDAERWVHDFGDGKGVIEGAYGPLFIRLATSPWKGIGIHGTHDPDSIGTNATEGCVRMRNDDLLEFSEMLEIGTTVTILPN